MGPVVERFVLDGTQTRLSRAALETLAVIAYRQPVTRARVSAVVLPARLIVRWAAWRACAG